MSDALEHSDDLIEEELEGLSPDEVSQLATPAASDEGAPLMDELTQEMDPAELEALDADAFEDDDEDEDEEAFTAADFGSDDADADDEDADEEDASDDAEQAPELGSGELGSEELAALVADVATRDPSELDDEPGGSSEDLSRTRISSLEMPAPQEGELAQAVETSQGAASQGASPSQAPEHDTDSYKRAMWVPTAPERLREDEDSDAIDTEVYPRIPAPASPQDADAAALRDAYDCLEIRTPIQELESYARARLETLARLGEAQQAETTLAAMQLGLNALCHVMGAAPKEHP